VKGMLFMDCVVDWVVDRIMDGYPKKLYELIENILIGQCSQMSNNSLLLVYFVLLALQSPIAYQRGLKKELYVLLSFT